MTDGADPEPRGPGLSWTICATRLADWGRSLGQDQRAKACPKKGESLSAFLHPWAKFCRLSAAFPPLLPALSSALFQGLGAALLSPLLSFCLVLSVLNSFSQKKGLFLFGFQHDIDFCRRPSTEKCRSSTGCRRPSTEKSRPSTVSAWLSRQRARLARATICRRSCTELPGHFCRRPSTEILRQKLAGKGFIGHAVQHRPQLTDPRSSAAPWRR